MPAEVRAVRASLADLRSGHLAAGAQRKRWDRYRPLRTFHMHMNAAMVGELEASAEDMPGMMPGEGAEVHSQLLHREGAAGRDGIGGARVVVDKHWRCKVGDLGLSKATEEEAAPAAQSSVLPDTPRWMAPELMAGRIE